MSGGTSHLQQTVDVLPRNTHIKNKKHRSVKPKNGFCASLMAYPNSNSNALARPNDSMTSTASVALRQRLSFMYKDLQLACTSRDFRIQFFCDVRDMRRLAMSGHKARKPNNAQVCKKKQGFSLHESVDRDHSEKCIPRLRERSDVPRLMFARYSVQR